MTAVRYGIGLLRRLFRVALEVIAIPVLVVLAIVGRLSHKRIDVGLGPEPLINNVHHKRALEHYGYTAETFVNDVYFITSDFDVRADLMLTGPVGHLLPRRLVISCYLFARVARRYRCIYIYFNGGPLGLGNSVLRPLEPWLLKVAGVKVVVMPYGGDIQDMSRTPNLLFRHAVAQDYPEHRTRRRMIARQVDRWTRNADHVLSGCDWVDYMYHWDTLMLAHFSIDVNGWTTAAPRDVTSDGLLRVLHAPNHRVIKGSDHFVSAITELAAEGQPIELIQLQGVPNSQIREAMESVDLVADQLLIGWYAMFAIEAMAMGKPVLCYLRDDLVDFYENTGLVEPGEIPLINCSPSTLKSELRKLLEDRSRLKEAQRRGPDFVRKHHSTEAVGAVFDRINRSLGLTGPTIKATR